MRSSENDDAHRGSTGGPSDVFQRKPFIMSNDIQSHPRSNGAGATAISPEQSPSSSPDPAPQPVEEYGQQFVGDRGVQHQLCSGVDESVRLYFEQKGRAPVEQLRIDQIPVEELQRWERLGVSPIEIDDRKEGDFHGRSGCRFRQCLKIVDQLKIRNSIQ